MSFKNFLSEYNAANSRLQDIISTSYTVMPVVFVENPGAFDEREISFNFISYFDQSTRTMAYTLTTLDGVEVKMLSNIPAGILVEFGKFVAQIEAWQRGDVEDFPFGAHSGDNAVSVNIRSEFQAIMPNDHDIDADEAKLE